MWYLKNKNNKYKKVYIPHIIIGLLLSVLLGIQNVYANTDEELKIASFNIQGGCEGPYTEGPLNLNRTIETLRNINADIILLQEVSLNASCEGAQTGQDTTIARALNMKKYYKNNICICILKSLDCSS